MTNMIQRKEEEPAFITQATSTLQQSNVTSTNGKYVLSDLQVMEMKATAIQKYIQFCETPNNAKLLDKWKNPIKPLNDWPKTENLLSSFSCTINQLLLWKHVN